MHNYSWTVYCTKICLSFFFQELIGCQENLAADISDYFGEKQCEEVSRYVTVHRNLMSHYRTLVSSHFTLTVIFAL
jgi:hypothetical protein